MKDYEVEVEETETTTYFMSVKADSEDEARKLAEEHIGEYGLDDCEHTGEKGVYRVIEMGDTDYHGHNIVDIECVDQEAVEATEGN